MENKSKNYRRLLMAGVAAVSLGLAPFFPEPHLLGKLRWLFGGAKGMQFQDYFDLLLHASPWAWLIYELYKISRSAS